MGTESFASLENTAAQTMPFVSNWDTTQTGTSTVNEISIPTNPTFTNYNYTVEWGNGMMDAGVTGDITHAYASPSTYTVSYRQFPRFLF